MEHFPSDLAGGSTANSASSTFDEARRRMISSSIEALAVLFEGQPANPVVVVAFLQLPLGVMLNTLAAIPDAAADAAAFQSQYNRDGQALLERTRVAAVTWLIAKYKPAGGQFVVSPELAVVVRTLADNKHFSWLKVLLMAPEQEEQ